METVISDYSNDANIIFEEYMQLYFAEYPTEKTLRTAKIFLVQQNDEYRKKINDLAIICINNNQKGKVVIDELLELNEKAVIKLHGKIMAISILITWPGF